MANQSAKKKRIGRWFVLAIMILFMLIAVVSNANLYRVHRETRRMRQHIAELHLAIDSMSIEIERLRSDTSYIEQMARELGMAKPDEKVYKYFEEKR